MTRSTIQHRFALGLALAGVFCFSTAVWGQPAEPTLDELLDLEPAPTPESQPEEGTSLLPDDSLAESISDALTAEDASDAFKRAVDEMDTVARRLGREFDAGADTQRMQESILRKLDQAIESAKQNNSGGGSSGGQGEQQQQDPGAGQLAQQSGQRPGASGQPTGSGSQASSGDAGTGSPIDPEAQDAPLDELRREWGVLPPRVREELSDGLRERFSPLYRSMTEAYYKALAEQE